MEFIEKNSFLDQDFSIYFPEIGEEIWHFRELPRAMSLAKDFINIFPSTANGRIIRAETLTEAKGRFERKWFAEEGGLWLALTIYDEFLETSHSLIPFIPGLAIAKCAHEFGIKQAKLKWINDLHVNGKKIAGVLMEKVNDWFILGIGINVNNPLPPQVPCESFKNLLKQEVPILNVLSSLVYWLRYYFGFLRFFEKCFLEEKPVYNLIIEDFKKFSDTLGRCVAFSYNFDKEDFLLGYVLDLTEKGSLLLQILDSNPPFVLEVFSGELIYLS